MRADTLQRAYSAEATWSPASEISEECEWLIDNAAAYERILSSIAHARRSVWITQLAIDTDCIAYGMPASPDTNVAEAIVDAAENRGIEVRILMNQTLLLDTVKPLRKWLAARGSRTIHVRGMSRFPQLLHAKMIVVDDTELFLVGSPFVNGYCDDPRHVPADTRRTRRELSGRPLHDVSVRLTGPAVAESVELYEDWWKSAATGDLDNSSDLTHRRQIFRNRKYAAMRLVSTSPATEARRARTDILDACLDGISRAKSLIYIEHQYLSARPIVDALKNAVDGNADLEIIAVLNQNPDITAYRRWQNDRLAKSGLADHPRVGVFSLWSTGRDGDRIVALNQIFAHSKVMLVDDCWAIMGSANLDGVSLHSYGDDFAGPFARNVFRHVRNFDVNVVIRDGVDGVARSGTVAELRGRLWAEHLGLTGRAMSKRPAKGWLSAWRDRAGKNVAALNLNDSRHRFHGFVLPYSSASTPSKQLRDLGIVERENSPKLQYNPGWAEVYLSPNWIRNMFL